MDERKATSQKEWKKPEVTVINLKDYASAIEANANSGGGGSCGCYWQVGCTVFL